MAPKGGTSGNFLEAAAKKPKEKPKSKKQEFPQVQGQESNVDRWTRLRFVQEAITNELKGVQKTLIENVEARYEKEVKESGTKSLTLVGKDYPDGATATWDNSFSITVGKNEALTDIEEEFITALQKQLLEAKDSEYDVNDPNSVKEAKAKARERYNELFAIRTSVSIPETQVEKPATTNFIGYALQTGELIAQTDQPVRKSGETDSAYLERLQQYVETISRHRNKLTTAIKQGSETTFADLFEVKKNLTCAKDVDMDRLQFDLPEEIRTRLNQKAAKLTPVTKSLISARLGEAMLDVADILDAEGALRKRFENVVSEPTAQKAAA